ncbi:MAG: hemerythrin domain-containing protein [Candidatus Brocadiaceae bacterium]|nr:hemerythrin domain-containing protein [Candidatus Brocadiaceae bacterium]
MKKFSLLTTILSCLCISSCTAPKHRVYHHGFSQETSNVFASEILAQEFDTIERVLNILKEASNQLKEGKSVPREVLYGIIDIIENFSDKHHQEKEDKILFPFLKTVQDGDKIDFFGQLLLEHVLARDKIRELSFAINNLYQGKKEKKMITKISSSYIKLMKRHMKTEEKLLFPWMNTTLSHDDQVTLVEKFKAVEKEDISAGVHEKYVALIEEIENQLGLFSK